VDDIKIDLREIGWDGVNWIDIAEDRDQWRVLVNTVLSLRVLEWLHNLRLLETCSAP
jgi:hypothetical protein